MNEIPLESMMEFVHYDRESGKLFWKKNIGTTGRAGQEAGALHHTGYKTIGFMGVRYNVHRVIWSIETGQTKFGEVDHINGDRKDNRFSNLRLVTRSGNQQNKAVNSNNTSGHTGVTKARNGRFRVTITKDRVRYGAHYETFEKACRAYRELKYMLHDEHGTYVDRLNEYRRSK